MNTRLLNQLRNLPDNEGFRYIVGIIEQELEVTANELEILSEGADRTIALAAKFGAFRKALRVLQQEPKQAAVTLEQWVEDNPDKAGRVIEDMATYEIE